MTKNILAALAGLALTQSGSASAQVLQQPEAGRASQWETYRTASGQEVMTCLYSFLLPPKGTTGTPLESMPVDHHRALCRLGDGSRFAWFFRFDLGSSGTTEKLWVDVESGHWISVRTEISIEPRRPHESWESWKARILDADPKLTTVHVETDGLRMPAFRETQREHMRRVVWQQLESQQPELAAFVRKLVSEIGQERGGVAASAVVAHLVASVYAGTEPTPRKLHLHTEKLPLSGDLPREEAFEKEFGRWASWPEPPRLKK